MTISRQIYLRIAAMLSCLWLGLWLFSHPPVAVAALNVLGMAEDLRSSDDSFYMQRVQPILDDYCVSCHGSDKAKGDLRLDSYRYVIFGGDEGEALRLGDPDRSLLIERMNLNPGDIKVMPPLGRPRPTSKEELVLSLWIANGASGTADLHSIPNAPEIVEEVGFPNPDWSAVHNRRSPYEKTVRELGNHYPSTVSYISANTEFVELNGITLRRKFDDQMLAEFAPLYPIVRQLEATNTGLSDESISNLMKMSELRVIRIAGTSMDSDTLKKLFDLPNIEMLVVDANQVGDGFVQRAEHSKLRLYIRQ